MSAVSNLLRPKLLDKLILQDLTPRLLSAICAFSMMLLIFGPILAMSRFIAAGFPLWIIAEFVGWDFTGFVSYTFPLGMLMASLLGFERLSRESESVALYAGGISFQRIIVPVFALGLLVSFVSYTFNDRIAPYANLRVAEFNDHRQDIIGETTKPFDLANRKDGKLQTTVHIEKGFDAQAKVLRQVTITFYDPDGQPTFVTYAARAKSHGSGLKEWTLYDARVVDQKTGLVTTHDQFDDTAGIQKTPENMAFLQRNPETLNFHDLQRQIKEMKAGGSDGADIRNAEVGLWFKTSLPFACLIFGLVGAPLGMRPLRGSKISGAFWALPIVMGYYVLYVTLQNLAQGGGVPPALAAWLPNILGLFVGAILIWKAAK
jgi:lipopolysaccharide export system permease protein